MKVYKSPIAVPAFDFSGDWQKQDAQYRKDLAAKLRYMGYGGQQTGEVVRFPVADGYAEYMVGQKGRSLILIHMALGDAYSIPDAHMRGLTQKDVIGMAKREKEFAKLFSSRKPA